MASLSNLLYGTDCNPSGMHYYHVLLDDVTNEMITSCMQCGIPPLTRRQRCVGPQAPIELKCREGEIRTVQEWRAEVAQYKLNAFQQRGVFALPAFANESREIQTAEPIIHNNSHTSVEESESKIGSEDVYLCVAKSIQFSDFCSTYINPIVNVVSEYSIQCFPVKVHND